MFRHQGNERTEWENRLLAGYLAWIAGFVNSAGFILIGAFTSHTTGNVGRLANETAAGHTVSAVAAGLLLVAFFAGAFVASMVIESNLLGRLPYTYALLLFAEVGLFGLFLGSTHLFIARHTWDLSAGVLCAAMGLQNSLVTRISGAVVRTTHLTGVITDMGVELARWFRFWRWEAQRRFGVRLAVGITAPVRPPAHKVELLFTIFAAFVIGSVAGAFSVHWYGRGAMVVPMVIGTCGALYAITNGQVSRSDRD